MFILPIEYEFFLTACLMIVVILLASGWILKLEQIRKLNKTVSDFRKSLDEMDEQAKLIVRTDLELSKTHEELDKRINGLYALQKISQDISKTLNHNEIFRRLSQEHIQEIGFQKAIIFAADASAGPRLEHQTGFSEENAGEIETEFAGKRIFNAVKERKTTFSSISKTPETGQISGIIGAITRLESFVVSPIVRKNGFYGFILLGNPSNETPLTEGDEELVAILATQIGQALDNAELFESAYSQHQELEKKVTARTKELSDTLSELKIVSKRKTDFVSAVSHELRTPLTSIKGYASILLSEKLGELPAQIKERLGKINKHSDELTHLVNDLLDIARIESGRFEMKLEPVCLAHTAESVVDLLGVQLKEKSATVEMNFPKELSSALADKTQIPRVFINLIGNAVKFIPPAGAIKISAFESAEAIQVNISDNGIGMSPEDAGRIFEEFYRVDNTINQKVKGTGLGLTLVKNIIQAHQGKIWVESRPNQGSTFSFILPKAK